MFGRAAGIDGCGAPVGVWFFIDTVTGIVQITFKTTPTLLFFVASRAIDFKVGVGAIYACR
jgi:hypothetical protein